MLAAGAPPTIGEAPGDAAIPPAMDAGVLGVVDISATTVVSSALKLIDFSKSICLDRTA
jgi:hypothetical protein